MRQFDDVYQADVAFASFHPSYIVSVQVRQVRERLLRKAISPSQFTQSLSKQ
jgi:hypothetical protein